MFEHLFTNAGTIARHRAGPLVGERHRYLLHCASAGAALLLRMLVIGALNWSIEWYKPGGRMNPGEIAEELADTIFDGVGPRSDREGDTAGQQLRRMKPAPRGPRGTARRANARDRLACSS